MVQRYLKHHCDFQGIILSGMKTIPFTLLGIQLVLRLFEFCSKCLQTRWVYLLLFFS